MSICFQEIDTNLGRIKFFKEPISEEIKLNERKMHSCFAESRGDKSRFSWVYDYSE